MDNIYSQTYQYEAFLEKFESLSFEDKVKNYDEYFLISQKELQNAEIIGISNHESRGQIILCEEDDYNYLVFHDDDSFYYLNSSKDTGELMQDVFGTKEYEVIDDTLIVKKGDKSLSNIDDLSTYHIKDKGSFTFDKNLNDARKEVLVDKEVVSDKANEELAKKYKLPPDTFNSTMTITDIEDEGNGKSTLTIEDNETKKKNYLYSDFDNTFTTEVKEKLSFKDSLKLAFEEVKNASKQMSIGFLEFYGAKFDEEHLNYDPKVVIENGEHKISRFNQDGSKNDLKTNLNKSQIDKELNKILEQQRLEDVRNHQQKKDQQLSHEMELKNK